MPPDDFTKELDRLWAQVRPLYLKLHAYVRMKLREKYGDVVPEKGPIPAHLLGNIWAQDWENIYPLVAPKNTDAGYSLDDILKTRKMSALDMVRTGERFYTSLGFDAAAEDVLGAIAVHPPAGPRGGLPRQRVGHRLWKTTCASRCASIRRPRTSRPSTTSWATTSTSART